MNKIPFPTKKYQIIYADPPWEYDLTGGVKNAKGLAKQHYQTMSTDEIHKQQYLRWCRGKQVRILGESRRKRICFLGERRSHCARRIARQRRMCHR